MLNNNNMVPSVIFAMKGVKSSSPRVTENYGPETAVLKLGS